MTRADVASALERWDEDSQSHITDVVRQAGHGVARLLRESQPEPAADGMIDAPVQFTPKKLFEMYEPAPVFDWNKAKPFQSAEEWYSGKPSNDETHARTAATVQWLMEHGGCFPNDLAPVGGDDEALLLAEASYALENWPTRNMRDVRDLVINLSDSLRAALADVARLERAIERWKIEEDAWIEREKSLMAALAAAEQEKEKAVAEEREACAMECGREAAIYAEAQDVLRRDACDDMVYVAFEWRDGRLWQLAYDRFNKQDWKDQYDRIGNAADRCAGKIRARAGRNDG